MAPIRPASRVAGVAADAFERLDAILSQLGNPIGVSAYKPYHSSGEDFLHSFLGMAGVPVELTPQFREDLPLVFLNASAAQDPGIVAKMDKQLRAGKAVVVTTGLWKALQGRGVEQFADLEVSDRKVISHRFMTRWRGVVEGSKDVLLPQLRYPTNDSWEEVSALDGPNGYPLVLHADYGKGRLFVLTIPDNFADLYDLPAPVLDHIRGLLSQGLPVRLSGPSGVSLFAYDNGAFVVHSFLPHAVAVEVILNEQGAQLAELGSAPRMPGVASGAAPAEARPDGTAFTVFLQPHSYRAFTKVAAGGAAGPSAHAFAVNRKLGRGVNIIGYDPIWQDRAKARFKPEYFPRIREAGFDSVRINLQPFKYMDAANEYALRPSWLETLDWAVKNALAARLAVILDMHEFHAMAEDPAGRKAQWLAFWTQIAARFKDAPDDVVFELLNEPFGKLTPEMWNDYLEEGLAVVRATNPTRAVDRRRGHVELDRRPAEGRAPRRRPQPDRDRPLLHADGVHAPGRAVVEGEQGPPGRRVDRHATRSGGGSSSTSPGRRTGPRRTTGRCTWASSAPTTRRTWTPGRRYTAAVARAAERLGWSWGYWQFDSDFVVYDVGKDAWVEPIRNALVP